MKNEEGSNRSRSGFCGNDFGIGHPPLAEVRRQNLSQKGGI